MQITTDYQSLLQFPFLPLHPIATISALQSAPQPLPANSIPAGPPQHSDPASNPPSSAETQLAERLMAIMNQAAAEGE